jgi:hypothetical protein
LLIKSEAEPSKAVSLKRWMQEWDYGTTGLRDYVLSEFNEGDESDA